ncbi:hypothetical protein ES332_D01G140400v1 [Gossypium tomentosum]|uniref:Uncharacterized protein n=2 Tax=Gossypium tomentosum TaxID=34277 RepID=A0A5D2M8S7_GOSTO|nr:hypothetical protein ES332_D01G140400v1 [Gossypium tomentosum]
MIFKSSTRLYIFQGPSELVPPEKDLKVIREAKIREEMLDREASLRRARAETSLSDGISWGMGEDAIEEAEVVENYKDFAFLDYARVGRALALYEVGDKEEAFAEMEDVSISLKGYPGETFCLWQGFLFNSHFKTFSTLCWDKVRCWDKKEVSLSAFAFLFSVLVQYNQTQIDNIAELERSKKFKNRRP